MIKRETKYIIRRIIISVGVILLLSFIRSCKVYAEEILTCGYNLKLNGNNVSMTNTSYLSANTNRQIRVGSLLSNANGITYYSGMKFYTDIIVVFNGDMQNYTSTHNGITYSFTNLGYIGNVQGFSQNDGIWLIRLIWEATNYQDGGNGDLMYQTFWNSNYIQDTGGSKSWGVAMRVIGENCGLASNMNINPQQYGEIINQLKQVNSKLSDIQTKLSTIITYINTTNSKLDTVNDKLELVRWGIYDVNGSLTTIDNDINGLNGNVTYQAQQTRLKLDDLITAINNGNLSIINAQQQTTTAINDMNDTIKNDNIDSPNNSISQMEQNLPTNSVISDLLTLPIRMFQNIVNAVNGSCSPFSLGALFGTNLVLPCINIQNYLGSALWSSIDVIFCGIFVLSMRKKFVEIFENITSLKNGGNELE